MRSVAGMGWKMKRLPNLDVAEAQVLNDIAVFVKSVRDLTKADITSTAQGIKTLTQLRRTAYEELNQIQHEEMILRAARFLETTVFSGQPLTWFWNPRQTGDDRGLHPVLRGEVNSVSVVRTFANPAL